MPQRIPLALRELGTTSQSYNYKSVTLPHRPSRPWRRWQTISSDSNRRTSTRLSDTTHSRVGTDTTIIQRHRFSLETSVNTNSKNNEFPQGPNTAIYNVAVLTKLSHALRRFRATKDFNLRFRVMSFDQKETKPQTENVRGGRPPWFAPHVLS